MRGAARLVLLGAEAALDDATSAACEAVLDPRERERLAMISHPEVRAEFLRARALVRAALSTVRRERPTGWRFEQNAHGRPRAFDSAGAPGPAFNLSHTRGLLAVLVHDDPEAVLGVDVEALGRRGGGPEVAERFFSVDEVRALRGLAPAAQRDRFFDYWTLKEAYIKARGVGVSLGLGRFSFVIDDPAAVTVRFDASLDDDPGRWRFARFDPWPGHRVALALGHPEATWQTERWPDPFGP